MTEPLTLADILATAEFLKAPVASKILVGSKHVLDVLRRVFTAPSEPIAWWLSPYGIPIVIDPMVGYDFLEVHDQHDKIMLRMKIDS